MAAETYLRRWKLLPESQAAGSVAKLTAELRIQPYAHAGPACVALAVVLMRFGDAAGDREEGRKALGVVLLVMHWRAKVSETDFECACCALNMLLRVYRITESAAAVVKAVLYVHGLRSERWPVAPLSALVVLRYAVFVLGAQISDEEYDSVRDVFHTALALSPEASREHFSALRGEQACSAPQPPRRPAPINPTQRRHGAPLTMPTGVHAVPFVLAQLHRDSDDLIAATQRLGAVAMAALQCAQLALLSLALEPEVLSDDDADGQEAAYAQGAEAAGAAGDKEAAPGADDAAGDAAGATGGESAPAAAKAGAAEPPAAKPAPATQPHEAEPAPSEAPPPAADYDATSDEAPPPQRK